MTVHSHKSCLFHFLMLQSIWKFQIKTNKQSEVDGMILWYCPMWHVLYVDKVPRNKYIITKKKTKCYWFPSNICKKKLIFLWGMITFYVNINW